jgi:hypothetical protein
MSFILLEILKRCLIGHFIIWDNYLLLKNRYITICLVYFGSISDPNKKYSYPNQNGLNMIFKNRNGIHKLHIS